MRTGNIFTALIVYVDDILLTSTSLDQITLVKGFLHNQFTIKDLGEAKYFLGLELARSSKGIYINQRKYTLDMLDEAGLTNAKAELVPMVKCAKFSNAEGPLYADVEQYRSLVGKLLYLGFTRPGITYATQLSQHVQEPHQIRWDAAIRVLRYLKSNPSKGLFYPASTSLKLSAYCDADWAACPATRRSLTGYCIFLGDALVSWKAKKQPTVSRSSAEAEYRSLATTVCELQWIDYILQSFSIHVSRHITVWCDNQAAIHIVGNPVFQERTKHIDIDCHLVRDQFKSGFIIPSYVASSSQLADIFTKPLDTMKFPQLTSKLGLVALHPVLT